MVSKAQPLAVICVTALIATGCAATPPKACPAQLTTPSAATASLDGSPPPGTLPAMRDRLYVTAINSTPLRCGDWQDPYRHPTLYLAAGKNTIAAKYSIQIASPSVLAADAVFVLDVQAGHHYALAFEPVKRRATQCSWTQPVWIEDADSRERVTDVTNLQIAGDTLCWMPLLISPM